MSNGKPRLSAGALGRAGLAAAKAYDYFFFASASAGAISLPFAST